MGYRFSKVRPMTNEIVEPDDINQNFKEYVDEINGNLSRENLRLSDSGYLQTHQFTNETFCEVFESSIYSDRDWHDYEGAALVPSTNTTGYTNVGKNGESMPSVEFTAERDGWIIVDFNASHRFWGTGLLSKSEAERKLLVKNHFPVEHWDRLAMHNSTLPCGGWIGITARDDEYPGIKGSAPIGHTTQIEVPGTMPYNAGFPQGKYVLQPVDRYGIKYRITLNGAEICETGWQYNGKDHNGCYTCGVIPVRAGRNIIKSEVAVASVENIWGTSQGIRADSEGASGGDKKGKYFPKTFVSSENSLSVLPDHEKVTFTAEDAIDEQFQHDIQKTGEEYTLNLGIKCWIGAANLLVQYRKG